MTTEKSCYDSLNQSWLSPKETDQIYTELLPKIDAAFLIRLRTHFHKTNQSETKTQKLDHIKDILEINEGQFVNAINSICGNLNYSLNAVKLFQLLDFEESGVIHWDQLLDRLIEYGKRKFGHDTESWALIKKADIKIEDLHHCKKESINIIIIIETPTSFCYVVISRHGKVGLYDGKFVLLTEYDVFFIRTGISRRVRDIWITASTYFSDTKSLIITASDKTMMIYDASTLCHVPIYLINGITNVPTCLSYNSTDKQNCKSQLVIGDDLGGLTTILFKQPRISLFYKKFQDKLNTFFWIELQSSLNEPFCKIKFNRRIHSRPVKKIVHIKHNNTIISCSSDPDASVVIRHISGIRDSYTFKISRGVTCFCFSETLGILVTGGGDGCVRIWEPVVTSKPSAIFPSQNFRIVDVAVLPHLCVVISFNKNGILKVWDVFDHVCIQSINVKFPSFGILGKPITFGFESIYCGARRKNNVETSARSIENIFVPLESLDIEADPKLQGKYTEILKWNRPEIIITCCNHIAIIPLDECPTNKRDELIDNVNEISDVLPPPEKTHRPRKPSIWDSDEFHTDESSSAARIFERQLSPIDNNADISSDENTIETINYDINQPSLEELLKRAGLTGLLERDFLAEMGLKHNMNTKLALQRPKQEKMRLPVSQGAPFTALDLYDHDEIKFSAPLPLSVRMKNKSGLEFFTDPTQILKYESCFSMSIPKSNYTSSDPCNSKDQN